MTIFVDNPMPVAVHGKPKFDLYCHMWSDTGNVQELHAFAAKIGLKKHWFQESRGKVGVFPHYDISPKMRQAALKNGAIHKSLREWIVEKLKLANDRLKGMEIASPPEVPEVRSGT